MTDLFTPPESLCYENSLWDKHQWEKAQEQFELEELIEEGTEKIYSFPTLGKEIFSRLHNEDLKPVEDILPEAEWSKKFHDELTSSFEFNNIQREIVDLAGNNYQKKIYYAATTAKVFIKKFAEALPYTEFVNPQAIREEFLTTQDQDPNDLEALNKIQQQGKDQVTQQQDFDIKACIGEEGLAEILEASKEELDLNLDNLSAFTWGDSTNTSNKQLNFNEQITLGNLLKDNAKLKEIAEIAGRLEAVFKTHKKKQTTKNAVPSGISLGNNLLKTIPQEWSYFTKKATKKLFLLKYSQKKLLQFDESKKELNLGPLVVCLDISGSTRGQIEIWTKATALVLLNIARKQKRDFHLICFNGAIVSETTFLHQDKLALNNLIPVLGEEAGGGTNWMAPLTRSNEFIKSSPKFKTADIILITDGVCKVHTEWLKKYRAFQTANNIHTYGILISQVEESLAEIVDDYICISDLIDDKLAQLFSKF